jgi:para-nitrobenzyl esterase
MDRRELLKSTLLSFGGAIATGTMGSWYPRPARADDAPAKPIVETNLGKLRGAFANGVYSFKGIHYGASTEGSMRFSPPSPPKPWTGIRDALEIGSPAAQDPQHPLAVKAREVYGDLLGPGQMGEDCLVLNVWTPSLREADKKPVMVWLHGAGYSFSSSGTARYDGSHLAAKHDVVVVNFNHRMNVFGYLYLGRLGGEKYADSGNVGMLDMVLALQWVRNNIARFGGDPNNVTIFGVSDGGAQVSTLMAMPPAKGLFHKAIVESGSELRANSPEEADATARKFLAQLQVSPDRVDDLQKIPMAQLISALHSMVEAAWGPVLDGRSLPRHPFDPDAPAITADVPMLIGTNRDESRVFMALSDPALLPVSESDLRTKLKASLQLGDDSKLDALIALYRKNRPNATPSDIYFAVLGDSEYWSSAITQAERKAAQHAAPVYMYRFDWEPPVFGGKLKAAHGIEIPFVLDNINIAPGMVGTGASPQPLADKISRAWTAFARTGNPNHPGLPHWPAYDASTRATMIFNNECKVVNDPGKEERLAMASLPQT